MTTYRAILKRADVAAVFPFTGVIEMVESRDIRVLRRRVRHSLRFLHSPALPVSVRIKRIRG